jgi:hypothetical protein
MYRRLRMSSTAFTEVSPRVLQIIRLTKLGALNRGSEVPKTSQKIKNRAELARFPMFHFCNSDDVMRVRRNSSQFKAS